MRSLLDGILDATEARMAVGKAERGLSIRHTGSIRGKLDDARRALGIAVKGFAEFKTQAEVLRATRVAQHPEPAPRPPHQLDAQLVSVR